MVEAQAAESSRKGGFVCRTHASTRTVLAEGPGGAGAVRGRAERSPQDSNPNSWEIGARNEGPRAGGWYPLLRSRGEGFPRQPGKPPLTLVWGRRRLLEPAASVV